MHSSCDAYRPLLSVFLCIHSAYIIELQLCAKHCVLGIEATVVIQVASLYSNGAHTLNVCVVGGRGWRSGRGKSNHKQRNKQHV